MEGFVALDTANESEIERFYKSVYESIDAYGKSGDNALALQTIYEANLWRRDPEIYPVIGKFIHQMWNGDEADIDYALIRRVDRGSQYWKHDVTIYGMILTIYAKSNNPDDYYNTVYWAVKHGFDLETYEKNTTDRQFINTEKYENAKKGIR
ncbi:MAG: hypothetical protein GQ574_11560 [Crocinitomix sp.]|nr:hypothetical protein [Crocinitomix sp.]